jgi:hypothetical protein
MDGLKGRWQTTEPHESEFSQYFLPACPRYGLGRRLCLRDSCSLEYTRKSKGKLCLRRLQASGGADLSRFARSRRGTHTSCSVSGQRRVCRGYPNLHRKFGLERNEKQPPNRETQLDCASRENHHTIYSSGWPAEQPSLPLLGVVWPTAHHPEAKTCADASTDGMPAMIGLTQPGTRALADHAPTGCCLGQPSKILGVRGGFEVTRPHDPARGQYCTVLYEV